MLAIVAIIIIIIIFPKLRWAREFMWGGVADRSGSAEERWGQWREPVLPGCAESKASIPVQLREAWGLMGGRHVPSHVLEQQIGLQSSNLLLDS